VDDALYPHWVDRESISIVVYLNALLRHLEVT